MLYFLYRTVRIKQFDHKFDMDLQRVTLIQPCNFPCDSINITMVILEKRNMNMNTTKFMKI